MLLGNTMVNIAPPPSRPPFSSIAVGDSGAIYATGLMTVLLLVFAEVMPKTVAINYPDRVSLCGGADDLLLRRHFRAGPLSPSRHSCARS